MKVEPTEERFELFVVGCFLGYEPDAEFLRLSSSPQADSADAELRARAREDRFKPGTELAPIKPGERGLSLEFDLNKGSPFEIDTVVTSTASF